jgi:hypothetical protein
MKEVTPEEIYQEYMNQYIVYTKGHYPRQIKNWDKIRAKSEWAYFERLAYRVNSGHGVLNYKLFIEALIDIYKGNVPAKMLVHPKSIHIYKQYIKMTGNTDNPDAIYGGVISSLMFVCNFCIEHNIKTIEEYAEHNAHLMPSLLEHIYNGSITLYFATIVPNIKTIIDGVYGDVLVNVQHNIKDRYSNRLSSLNKIPKIAVINQNLGKYFDEVTKKIIENNN